VGGETALTAADGAWWGMDHPTNLMTITAVFTFAEPFEMARLRRLAEERLLGFDRFRQRVVKSGLGRPRWVDDPAFSLANHLHEAVLSAPGDRAALQALVGELMSTPLPKDRPLWQFHLVPFERGHALIARVHHCIADGMSLVQVLLSLADTPPSFVQPRPPATERHAPTRGMVAAERVRAAFRAGGGLAKTVAGILDLRADPRTPLRGRLGRAKLAVWSDPIALDEVRAVGKHVGATVNDVLLSAVAGALRRYLEHRHARAEGITLRAVVPVNLRRPDDVALGNRFGLVFLPLPVGHRGPLERLHAVKRAMDAIKRSPEAVVIFGLLRAFGATTVQLLETAVNLLGRKATTVMTNVPGPRDPVRFYGRAVDSMMFWVPQSGRLGLGVSILSYCGQVRVGIAADAGLVPDPHHIVEAFHDAFQELKHVHGPATHAAAAREAVASA
jgi:WS/DGAT/MGAT family acyltransferase